MAQTQTVEDLGKAVKLKYPGTYDSISDAELGARTKLKYPDAYGQFTDLAKPTNSPLPKVPISLNPVEGLVNTQSKLGPDPRAMSVNDVLSDVGPLSRTAVAGTVGGLAGMGGAALGGPGVGEITGAAGFSITDELLRKLFGDPSGAMSDTGKKSLATSIPESAIENLVTGKVLQGLFGAGKGIVAGAKQRLSPDISLVKGTTASQVGPEVYSHNILKTIEEMFYPSGKKDAMAVSAKDTLARIESKVQDLTETKVKLTEQYKLADEITSTVRAQLEKSEEESNARGAALKLLAKGNPESVPVMSNVKTPVLDQFGNPTGQFTNKAVQTSSFDIEGRTNPTNSLSALHRLRDEFTTGSSTPDPESKILKKINQWIDAREMPDANGNMVEKPISFAQAWKDKQEANAIGHPGTKLPEFDYNDTRFKTIAVAIDKDIEQSIPAWKNGGPQGTKLWDQTMKIVNARHNILDDVASTLKLEEVTNPDERINKVIDNYKILQGALNAGKLQFPTDTGFSYSATNLRKALQGYQLMRMANGATTNGVVDTAKLLENINDAKMQNSLTKLFGTKNLNGIKDAFKAYSLVDSSVNAQGQRFMGVRIVARGLEFGPALAGALVGLTTRSPVAAGVGLATTGGAIFSFHTLAKWMTNETTGPVIGKMMSGMALNQSQRLAMQTLANVAKGEIVDINNEKYKINADGKLDKVKP
jgi:hypothetical protein